MAGCVYPILYSFRRCPYAMRARSAMVASGLVCELREVVLRDKPQALLDISPKATVPVLVDIDGRVIDQSLDIMLWALRQNDPAAWLAPTHGDLDAMLLLVDECEQRFKYQLDRYKYPQRYGNTSGNDYRDGAGLWLHLLEARLEQSPYLFGGRASLADMAIVPFVRQFAHTDVEWFGRQPWPRLQQWLLQWSQSDLFLRIMEKYPPWNSQAPSVLFPH
ncbi:glutathione S-transferase [Alcaligenaceae bacterium]|nr:glutathione S-transferase [Alcaligenaceae bacterium]